MADPIDPLAPAAPAIVAVEPMPVVAAEPAALPASLAPADVVAEPVAPAAEIPPPPVAADATPKPAEPPASEPTLLEKFDAEQKDKDKPAAVEPEKPVEAKKPDDPAAAEPAKEPEAVEPPKAESVDYFTDVKIPETIKLDDATRGEVTSAFDLLRSDPKAGTQALLALHNKQMTAFAEDLSRKQHETFNDTRKGWQTEVMADPEFGGSGYQTSMATVARMRDMFLSDHKPGTPKYEADVARMDEFLRVTGAGDHPWFLKMMKRVGKAFDEPGLPPPNPKPAPNNGRRSGDKAAILYDRTPRNSA